MNKKTCFVICLVFISMKAKAQSDSCYQAFLSMGIEAWYDSSYSNAINYLRAAGRCDDCPRIDSSKLYLDQVQFTIRFNQRLQEVIPLQTAAENLCKNGIYEKSVDNYYLAINHLDYLDGQLQNTFILTKSIIQATLDKKRTILKEQLIKCISLWEQEQQKQRRLTSFWKEIEKADTLKNGGPTKYTSAFQQYVAALSKDTLPESKKNVRLKLYQLKADTENCLVRKKNREGRKKCFTRNNYTNTYMLLAELDDLLEKNGISGDKSPLVQAKVQIALDRNPNYYPNDQKNTLGLDTAGVAWKFVHEYHRSYFGKWELSLSFNIERPSPFQLNYTHQEGPNMLKSGTAFAQGSLNEFHKIFPHLQFGLLYRPLQRWQIGIAHNRTTKPLELAFEIPENKSIDPGRYGGLMYFKFHFSNYWIKQTPMKLVFDLWNENHNQVIKKRILEPQVFLGAQTNIIKFNYQITNLERATSEDINFQEGTTLGIYATSPQIPFKTILWELTAGGRLKLKLPRRHYFFIEAYIVKSLNQPKINISNDTLPIDQELSDTYYGAFQPFNSTVDLNRPQWSASIGYLFRLPSF